MPRLGQEQLILAPQPRRRTVTSEELQKARVFADELYNQRTKLRAQRSREFYGNEQKYNNDINNHPLTPKIRDLLRRYDKAASEYRELENIYYGYRQPNPFEQESRAPSDSSSSRVTDPYELYAMFETFKNDPSPENRKRLYKIYWEVVTAPQDVDTYQDRADDSRHLYIASMLVPKPDPMGRFILGDHQSTIKVTGEGSNLFILSGGQKPLILAETHPKPKDEEDHEARPDGKQYLRMHSLGPGGARVQQCSFGTPSYFGTALAAKWFLKLDGIYSTDGGGGRTTSGRQFWQRLLERKIAYELPAEMEDFEEFERHDARFKLTDEQMRELDENQEESYSYGRGNVTREQSTRLRFRYTGQRRKGGNDEFQYIDYERALDDPFLVFHAGVGNGLWTALRSTWSGAVQPGDTPKLPGRRTLAPSPVFQRLVNDNSEIIIKNPDTRKFLTNAVHGSSPFLALTIAETLARSGSQDLAATYLTRGDVAPLFANSQWALEILGQQRLPGLSGIGKYTHRAVMTRLNEVKGKGVKVNWSAENPLGLAELDARQKKLVAAYSDVGDPGE